MPDTRRIYWDSCVLLAYINGEDEADRRPMIQALMEDARQRQVEILTSTATIVEVAFAAHERDGAVLDPQVEADIEALWDVGSPIALVEFYDALAFEARDLIRFALEQSWTLKPYDAIHLATAAHYAVAEFHTYDVDKLAKFATHIGCSITAPQGANSPPPML